MCFAFHVHECKVVLKVRTNSKVLVNQHLGSGEAFAQQ